MMVFGKKANVRKMTPEHLAKLSKGRTAKADMFFSSTATSGGLTLSSAVIAKNNLQDYEISYSSDGENVYIAVVKAGFGASLKKSNKGAIKTRRFTSNVLIDFLVKAALLPTEKATSQEEFDNVVHYTWEKGEKVNYNLVPATLEGLPEHIISVFKVVLADEKTATDTEAAIGEGNGEVNGEAIGEVNAPNTVVSEVSSVTGEDEVVNMEDTLQTEEEEDALV